MKQALQQGVTSRSRWLLQILGSTLPNVCDTEIFLRATLTNGKLFKTFTLFVHGTRLFRYLDALRKLEKDMASDPMKRWRQEIFEEEENPYVRKIINFLINEKSKEQK